MIIDVSDKANPTLLSTMADTSDQHTVSCILDCTWLYGSEGAIVDLRDPKNPKLSKNTWDKGTLSSYHDVTEVKPGIVLTSSQPMILLDARTDPENPTLIDSTEMPGFTHANLWPHLATDQFALVGGESTGPGCSNDASATFQTWDTTGYEGGKPFKLLSQFAMSTGAPTSGQSPETTYCVHWFQPHPTYANGGLLSIAWYEHGVRLLQISGEGKISEIGWYVPIAGQSSDVDWINDKVIYVADYLRGLDILRYTGPVPQGRGNTSMTPVTPGAPPAMGGGSPSPAGTTPVVAGQSFSAYVTLPRAGRCVKAKTFRIKVRKTKDPVTSLTISINAKKALTVKGKKLKKPITLKKLPRKKAFTLQVVLKTKAGHTSGDQHSYRGC
jgi:hypothetical protein